VKEKDLVMKQKRINLAEKATTEHAKNLKKTTKNARMNAMNDVTKNESTRENTIQRGRKNTKRNKTNNTKAENAQTR
jgi:hypothetical protein